MKPGRRRAPNLPIGMLMAEVILVVAVVLVFGAYRQNAENGRNAVEVANRQTELDQAEAALTQRRSSLDQREDALSKQAQALSADQKALEDDKAKLTEADAALTAREQALTNGVQALADDRAALTAAKADLESREKAFSDRQADYDARLSDYAELQRVVDDALNARGRIASALKSAIAAAGVAASVDEDGAVSIPAESLFTGSSASLSIHGKERLDALLPVWYAALKGESLSTLSVEVTADMDDAGGQNLSARRALAILTYALETTALDQQARAMLLQKGLTGARANAGGESTVVFKFTLNNDALRSARAG